ncbi:MAG: 1,4-alpha-glucan branching protein GlgB [Acidimicrobiales bacterium]|nr:1,4-alpha-glucan branching protein GlgB [Acidimicrobiales bacterium]
MIGGISEEDLWLFNEGSHTRLYEKLGAHLLPNGSGTVFAVWAPNARRVSVIGDFNAWRLQANPLEPIGSSGIWAGVVQAAGVGDRYKFHIESRARGYSVDKADPFAFRSEQPPRTASIVCALDYEWADSKWMAERARYNALDAPISIYEMHLGSWRHAEGEHRSLNYRELALPLAEHVSRLGFTHVEFLPVMEHPFYGSWGYQITGYFAPTARFGAPQDLMYLIDVLHQHGIGVILDWVPSHFPSDQHGLGFFDGTHLYEHADPRKGLHPDWGSLIFNYDRHEVRSFLLSSACFWLDLYHADGLRVDAVASMLYLDYSRKEGEWVPNEHGGNENLGALRFLKRLNEVVYRDFPDVQTIAEESTAWPMVSRPTNIGGLGFGMKWDLGWMHDTLQYFERDPLYRKHHHNELTFRMVYAFTENFCLPLSHDEVVHGKGSLLQKMTGDRWQRFANLRCLFGYQYTQPGKKLLFMGSELAPETEWDFDHPLPWHLLEVPEHLGVFRWLERLNQLVRDEPALHEVDFEPTGFEWIVPDDPDCSVFAYLRWPRQRGTETGCGSSGRPVLVVLNLTPVPREGYRVGIPVGGRWDELANSDAEMYGGSGWGNLGGLEAAPLEAHSRPFSLSLVLPPLSVLVFAPRA